MSKTVYIVQWEHYGDTWLDEDLIYEDEAAAYIAIDAITGVLYSSGIEYLYGKVIPATLHTNN